MTSVTRQLFDLPDAMKRLPLDKRGYPVPEFVAWIKGEPDFRVVKPGWWAKCVAQKVCWLCGGSLSKRQFFVIGPMCSVTRTTTEPPCHRGCAMFAIKNCPFLTRPMAVRNERGLPEERHVAGEMIARNPGVTCLWESADYKLFKDPSGQWLIEVGDPVDISFWREGRRAERAETLHSIETGLPLLRDIAEKQGSQAVMELTILVREYFHTIFAKYA